LLLYSQRGIPPSTGQVVITIECGLLEAQLPWLSRNLSKRQDQTQGPGDAQQAKKPPALVGPDFPVVLQPPRLRFRRRMVSVGLPIPQLAGLDSSHEGIRIQNTPTATCPGRHMQAGAEVQSDGQSGKGDQAQKPQVA